MRTSTLIAAALVLAALAALILKAVVLVFPLLISALTIILVATLKIYIARKLSKKVEENEDTLLEKMKKVIG